MTTQSDLDQLDEMLERWQQAMEALRPAFEALREAICQLGEAMAEVLRPALEALVEWWVSVKRHALYLRLRRWRVPHRPACFLAQRWPERWLPEPEM